MNHVYKKLKSEILQDHKMNNFMKPELMPLTDKLDISTEVRTEYKKAAQQLTNDPDFPYEVIMWHQGNTLKGAYKPLK